jgi:hypothetical protein
VFQGGLARESINGDVTLSWDAAPGRVYRVQYKNDLSDPTWSDLIGTVAISGSHGAFVDKTAGTISQRFYRITLGE